ncbi:MAG TPA: methyltransferase domain-containing protein [Candidatus Paceibacterota bacterium]|nr:methyltransferase domain-containing protein [Verrucomicrobiota bacterium]HRY51486.1 methyltransferase domain-containing protein [Candidatus Paceibacterota bacterium]
MQIARLILLGLLLLWTDLWLEAASRSKADNRNDAIVLLCRELGIGPGAVVADVGCGDGIDTFFFADVVGPRGAVLAQEIDCSNLKRVAETAERRGLHHVVPVLGQSKDPHLPDHYANLVYMNRVFHHLSHPQSMLKHLWTDLKPGGWLVIVDQQKGPLTDWAPMEIRENQHHWTGETTVVRLAREAGFLFHDVLDDVWHEKQPFVLAFRKPEKSMQDAGDPDLPPPLRPEKILRALQPALDPASAVVFFGLDAGRAVLPALRERLPQSVPLYDIVMDEWALSRQELPAEAPRPGTQIFRTEKNTLALPEARSISLTLFVDAYHRLWEPLPLLKSLKTRMPDSSLLAIIDRQGPPHETRRLAGHRRRISPQLVTDELRQAGFHLRRTLPAPDKDRFFLLFAPEESLESKEK